MTDTDRDNDLRARVNRQARIRLGDAETPEKSKWVINEIVRRRARRQEKQISQAAKSGDFPLFSNSETIRENLLTSSSEIGLHASAQRLRRLVVDVLFPAHDKGEASHRHQSLRVLSEAMSNGDAQVDENFQTVFANIAGHEVACNAIRSAMEPFIPEDDEEAEEEGTGKSHSLALDIPQNHIIVTLNKVLQLLRELDDIGNKQEKASLAKVTKAKFGARNPSQRDNRLHLKEFGISESQLEDFLVSINGGPLEPDSDDDLAAELFENDLVIEVPSPVSPQSAKNTELSDSDIWDIINQVLETFLERCLSKPKRGRRTKKSLADENRAKERAQKVEDLLMDIGIGSDRPLNDVESEAVSEFCIRLRSFKDTQSLGEDLPIPTVLAHCIPLPRCDPIDTPDANGLQKHKPTDDSIEIGHSPAAALALPDGTNPFADDDMAMPPSKNHRSILSSSPRNTEAQSSHTLKIVGVQHQTSPNSFDAQIPSYGSYPQFRPINALGSVHP